MTRQPTAQLHVVDIEDKVKTDCPLDGPCGLCATLTPAARAALAETLAVDAPTPAHPYEESGRPEHLLRWDNAISEQTGKVESATYALVSADSDGPWREACCTVLEIEIAKTVGLIVAAPVAAHIIRAGSALTAARRALADMLPQP